MTSLTLPWIVVLVLAVAPRAPGTTMTSRCPATDVLPGPGVVDPFHVPPQEAAQLNADGKMLYRQGRWDDARQKYRAAEAADPDFLAPALNVACSFVRQERFGEAMIEVMRLVDRAYLPWSHEVLSAADLGALKIRAEWKPLQAALAAARLRWAQDLARDLIFVARVRAPLKLGGPAVVTGLGAPESRALVLGQRQEVFAWSPWTRRYRQLTSEDGRVLAVGRSRDGRRISYITAEKLIREAGGGTALRGLVVNELDLGTLVSIGRAPIAGDVRRVEAVIVGAGFAYRIENTGGVVGTFAFLDGRLQTRAPLPQPRAIFTLTGAGATNGSRTTPLDLSCGGDARDVRAHDAQPQSILVTGTGSHPARTAVGGPFGAGLIGLPIP